VFRRDDEYGIVGHAGRFLDGLPEVRHGEVGFAEETEENLRGKRVDVLKLSSKEDAGEALVRFFNRRRARR
jgi:hypothetical protein